MAIRLNWATCGSNQSACPFYGLNLESVREKSGVYVIWSPSLKAPRNIVRVGQGNIVDRIGAHRNDQAITKHGKDLLVTWAAVPANQMDGVERYLAETLAPLVGDRFPNVNPIAVNLPGS